MRAAALLLAALAAPALGQPLVPTDLRVEGLAAPVGLDVERPRLSWALDAPADARGAVQRAYQIRVEAGGREVWDSGRVESGDQHLVPYGGPALAPGAAVRWAVRVWGRGEDEPSGWAGSEWTAGRLGDWGPARWIGVDTTLAQAIGMGPTGTPRLRRTFRIEKPVARAVLHVTGLGQVIAHLNGRRLGRDRMAPGWTDPAHRVLYATHDVTDAVRQGENVVGVELGGGLYRIPQGGEHAEGRYAKYWDTIGPFQAIAYLAVEHADGTQSVVASDGQWTAAASPTVFSSIWGGEDYDARREQPGWAAPGYDASAGDWRPARVLPGPGGALVAQTNPPITAHETFRAVAVTEPRPGVFVVDLGHNHSGQPRLSVRGAEGQTVTLRPSEVLAADGTVDPTSLKHWGEIVFRYTARGDSVETWRPRFMYTGYRYLQIEGATVEGAPGSGSRAGSAPRADRPHVVAVESDWVHADAQRAGTLATSDTLVNGVHDMIVGAIRSNMMSVMTDCPHREKLGWLEEAYLMGPSVFYNYRVGPLYAKWARDMEAAQEPGGLVPTTAPEYTFFGGNFRDSPEWGSAVVQAPWLTFRWTGDDAPLRAHRDAMRRYVDYLDTRREPDGTIRYGLGDWYDIGPNFPGESQLTSKGITATATQALNLSVLSEIARHLGDGDEAAAYRARFVDTRRAFNRAFWRSDVGHYDTGSQTAQAMPLVVGLVPAARQRAAFETLVADVVGRGHHPTAGDVGHRYLVQALADAGRADVLWELATQTDAPSYGAQLLAGATTLTEAWDANPVQSQNHFMLGHLEEWLWSGLAGIAPVEPGWRRFRVAPAVVGDLGWVEATQHTPYGEVSTRWRRDGDALTLELTVPVGTRAEVALPTADAGAVREGAGPAASAAGVVGLGAVGGRTAFEVGPGRYVFTAPLGR